MIFRARPRSLRYILARFPLFPSSRRSALKLLCVGMHFTPLLTSLDSAHHFTATQATVLYHCLSRFLKSANVPCPHSAARPAPCTHDCPHARGRRQRIHDARHAALNKGFPVQAARSYCVLHVMKWVEQWNASYSVYRPVCVNV